MAENKITLTRDGYNKMVEKLEYLKGPKRRQLAEEIGKARALGDLSENAEYDAARDAQGMNEKQISELEDILGRARIIDDSQMSRDEALLGATVKLKDLNNGESLEYMLVAEEESDYDMNKISVTSPVGKALLGRKAGETVEIKVPACLLRYEILEISR